MKSDSSPHSNVGLIYYMTERFPAARQHWSAAVEFGHDLPARSHRSLIIDGKFADAQTQLEDYTKKTPEDEDGWLMLGDVYRALGNDSAARVTDARAAQIAPEYVGLKRPNLKTLRGAVPRHPPGTQRQQQVRLRPVRLPRSLFSRFIWRKAITENLATR